MKTKLAEMSLLALVPALAWASDYERFFSGLITFEGAADSEFWEDATFSDLHYDSASGLVSIGLTYVPESSTCAALFGALSLLLVLARRRG